MGDTPGDAALDAAMRELLGAPSMDDLLRALERHPILLSPATLKTVIEEANAEARRGNHFERVWLLVHAWLLNSCQEHGLEQGFAQWQSALEKQVPTALEWIKHYLDGAENALNQALEESLWALMGARRAGPLAKNWDPLLLQVPFLIHRWITQHQGGTVAMTLLGRLLRENLERVDRGDPSWPERANLYADSCFDWFERSADPDALDKAIELSQQAVAVRAEPSWISELGRLHLLRFELKRSAEDLAQALAAQRSVIRVTQDGPVELRAEAHDRLGMTLRTSFEQSGVVSELDEAVACHEEAVRIAPLDAPLRAAFLGNLASALIVHHALTGEEAANTRAGELLRQEVDLCKAGHPLHADARAALAGWLSMNLGASPANAAEAADLLREAISLAAERHVKWAWELSLAQLLRTTAGPSPDDERRVEAHRRIDTVLAWAAPEWPQRAAAVLLLGQLQADAGLPEAGATLADVVAIGIATRPDTARSAAACWRDWAIATHRNEELKKACERSLDVLDAVSLRQMSIADQLAWRHHARPDVEDAAAALAAVGELEAAVAHLERGRVSVLRQALGAFSTSDAGQDEVPGIRQTQCLYLVAARAGGVALVRRQDGIVATPLPGLTLGRVVDAVMKLLSAHEQRTHAGGILVWRRHLESVTRWMGEAVLEPLRDTFRHLGQNVAVLTDGLVASLPWAAAWVPEDAMPDGRRHLIELPVDLTLAPTAGVLKAAQTRARAVSTARILLVAPRDAPGLPLQHADAEVAAVAAARPDARELRLQLTLQGLLGALQDVDIVHFACHTRVDLTAPLRSCLVLGEGEQLDVATLLAAQRRPRRLAVLSACETSAASVVGITEAIGFPVAFLYAGFAGVVGTLWPIRDDAAALLMSRFHQALAEAPPAGALARAQRWLRDLPREQASTILGRPVEEDFAELENWAAFVFTGA